MDPENAADLLSQRLGRPVAARLVNQLVRRTDGDLTLLAEIADQIDPDTDGLQRAPIRWPAERLDRVERQLATLDSQVRDVLGGASVIGREFDLAILELAGSDDIAATAAGSLDSGHLLDALDSAVTAGVLSQLTAGVFSFASALARELCYDSLTARARARWHERAAGALSGMGALGGSRAVTVVELAYHLAEAAALGGAHRLDAAIAASAAAGGVADEEADYDLAAGLYAQAALLAGRAGWAPGPAGRLLVAAGVARLRSATAEPVHRVGVASLTGALRLARRCGDTGLLAAAALGLGPRPSIGMGGGLAAPDPTRHAALAEALGAHPDRADSTSARLAARFALETEDRALAQEALALAGRLADPRALAEALLAAAQCGIDEPDLLDQAVREAAALHDRELLARAYDARAWSAYRSSGWTGAQPELARLAELAGFADAAQPSEPANGSGRPVAALVRWYALRAKAVIVRLSGDPAAASWAARALVAGRAVDPAAASAGHALLPAQRGGPALAELTNREREVAMLAVRGTPTRNIAEALFLGERTVETHLASIYRKLGIRSRIELITKFGDSSAQL